MGGGELQVAEAALIILVVSASSDTGSHLGTEAPRTLAQLTLAHPNCQEAAQGVLRLLTQITCGPGGGLWDPALALLAFILEGFFSIGGSTFSAVVCLS